MDIYARVQDGLVAEIFSSDLPISTLFHPSLTWAKITGISPQPQLGWIASLSGNQWHFSPPPPPERASIQQQAQSAFALGINVSSSSNQALNGTYSVNTDATADIVAIETSLNAGRGFPPGGATSLSYPDITGSRRTFNETEFANFAAAVRDYVYELRAVIGGSSQTLPSPNVTIP